MFITKLLYVLWIIGASVDNPTLALQTEEPNEAITLLKASANQPAFVKLTQDYKTALNLEKIKVNKRIALATTFKSWSPNLVSKEKALIGSLYTTECIKLSEVGAVEKYVQLNPGFFALEVEISDKKAIWSIIEIEGSKTTRKGQVQARVEKLSKAVKDPDISFSNEDDLCCFTDDSITHCVKCLKCQ